MILKAFNVVIGMDWFGGNQYKIYCKEKMDSIKAPNGEIVYLYGERHR